MEEGFSEVCRYLEGLDQGLVSIGNAIENIPGPVEYQELQWKWIEERGLIPLLKGSILPTLEHSFKGPVKLRVVPGYTLPEDDHGDFYEAESTYFMFPQQWALLKDTHISELNWRFLTEKWQEREFMWVKSKWGEEDFFWVTLKKIDKQLTSSNCIVLTFEVRIQISVAFVHGPFACKAAVQHLPSETRMEPLCVEEGMQCINGHARFACNLHREFAERTVCTVCEKEKK